MGLPALILLIAYVVVTLGVRAAIQYRLTGSTGIHGVNAGAGFPEWAAAVFIVLAAVGAIAAPVVNIVGILSPVSALDRLEVRLTGLGLYVFGFGLTFAAQMTMGRSWRVGVAAGEVTELVTRGLFVHVRNPIFTGMMIVAVGLALLLANAVAIATFVVLICALELQVRYVEEPYLLRVHGDAYARYAANVGRFVPLLGRLESTAKRKDGRTSG